MIIKNHKHIYTKTAERFDLDRDRVEMVGHFTWANLNEMVSNFEYREIYVLGLGSFRFRKKESDRYLKRTEEEKTTKIIQDNSNPENVETNLLNFYIKRARIQRLSDQWNEIIREKLEFKTKLNDSINRDIQEQETDLGRTEEPSI